MLSVEQLDTAHSQIRELAQEIAIRTDDPDSLEHAIRACDHLRMATQVTIWSQEYWMSRGLEQALKATSIEPAWTELASRISTLLACHQGLHVA